MLNQKLNVLQVYPNTDLMVSLLVIDFHLCPWKLSPQTGETSTLAEVELLRINVKDSSSDVNDFTFPKIYVPHEPTSRRVPHPTSQ